MKRLRPAEPCQYAAINMRGKAHISVELENLLSGHLVRPYGRREDEAIRCSRFRRVFAKFLRLSGGLRTRPRNDDHILESVVVQRLPGQADRLLSFVVREVLRLAIAALHEDTSHSALRVQPTLEETR